MRNNGSTILSRLICAGLAVAFVLPPISWLVWSFGVPVGSLFSAEGLRWIFVHSISHSFNENIFFCVLACTAFGVWQCVLSHPTISVVRRRAIRVTLLVASLMAVMVSLAAFHPDSPLLSINGTLDNSPFSHGFIPAFFVSVVQLGVIYGFVVGAVRSLDALVSVLVRGIGKFAAWLLLFFIISFDYACLMYIFQNT